MWYDFGSPTVLQTNVNVNPISTEIIFHLTVDVYPINLISDQWQAIETLIQFLGKLI